MKQAIITIFLSVLTFVLCACSGDGITDTYWRDDKTGEWLIGLTEDKLVDVRNYMMALANAHITERQSCSGLASSALPEAKCSQTGVSVSYTKKEDEFLIIHF